MDKLELINKSINEIRTILGAECTPIEGLPAMVRALAEDPSKSGFTTSFVFSNEIGPARPTGGSLDTTTGLVTDLDEGWYQTEPIAKKRSASESSKIWMSFATFKPDGTRVTEWSTPMNLKGAQGSQGLPGDPGEAGPAGPKGEKGTSASYRTVSAYTSTDTLDTPLTPYGGNWVFATNELFPPQSDDENEWFTNADIKDRKKYLWLSQATFNEVGDIVNNWCEPFRLTGEDGQDGVDGSVTEFIYRLLPDYKAYQKLVAHLGIKGNELYSDPKNNDVVPTKTDNIYNTEWTDSPRGITESLQIEVCCRRTRKSVNENWSKWSNCVIWSKWGEDGMDGDGVEYIYLITPENIDGKKITAEIIADPINGWMPDRYQASKLEKYQENEFCFDKEHGYEGYTWTDEPSDVGPGEPMEWVSVRKKIDGVWEMFSDPKLWATYSEDGDAYITSFVFKRAPANETVSPPQGGDFFDPRPDNTDWHDSIPEENPQWPVWMSTRTFTSGKNTSWDKDWSKPTILADSANFQVEYKEGKDGDNPPIGLRNLNEYNGDEVAWRKDHSDWGDENDVKSPTWMATASCKNGVWTDWTITRIKGEKGEPGPSGSSVQISSKVDTLDKLHESWNTFITDGTWPLDVVDNKLTQGEGCYVESEGELYVYNGGYYEGESTEFDTYWFHTKIEGEPGKGAYIYIAYSDTLSEDGDVWIEPTHPAKYMGLWYTDKVFDKNSDELKNRSHYSWIKWSGEDGWGYEQIFLLTSKDLEYNPNGYHPPLPGKQEGDNVAEYLPYHEFGSYAKPYVDPNRESKENRWSDTPLTPTEEYPFCWVATRKVKGSEFGEWRGDSYNTDGTDSRVASLYSRYTVDGVSGVYIELSNDFAFIPLEDGKIDPDFILGISNGTIKPVFTTVRAYEGDEKIDPGHINVKENKYISVLGSTINLRLETIDESITEIPLEITVGDRTYEKSWKLFYDSTGYQITTDAIVIRRKIDGYLDKEDLEITVTKWDGKNFVLSGIPVFATIYFDNGNSPITLSSAEGEIRQDIAGGTSTIKLGGYESVSTIRVYVVNQNEKGEYLSDSKQVSFQDIGIVFDGKNTHSVNLTNDMGTIPLESDGRIDPEAEMVTTQIEMYDGPDKVTEGVTYSATDKNGNAITGVTCNDTGLVTVYPSELKSPYPNEIKCTADLEGISLSRIFRLNITENAYELYTDSAVLHRDPYSGTLLDPDIKCTVKRWNSTSNQYEIPPTSPPLYVHAECRHLNDEDCTDITPENAKVNPEDGTAIIDLLREINLISFRLYVSTEETLEKAKKNWLTFEDIGVISDGKQGVQGEAGPTITVSDTKYYTDEACTNEIALQNIPKGSDYWIKITYSTGGHSIFKQHMGNDGVGKEGASVTSQNVEYSTDGTNWSGTMPNLNPGDTLWTKVTFYNSNGERVGDPITTKSMAGTQGATGAVGQTLFYLGSFKNGTLKGGETGRGNARVVDYFETSNGYAFMRDSSVADSDAAKIGDWTDGVARTGWIKSETVGFIKANAITTDMLNADYAMLSKLFATTAEIGSAEIAELDCTNINVTNLNASSITAGTITAKQINYSGGFLSGGNTTGNQINKIQVGSTSDMDKAGANTLFIVIS